MQMSYFSPVPSLIWTVSTTTPPTTWPPCPRLTAASPPTPPCPSLTGAPPCSAPCRPLPPAGTGHWPGEGTRLVRPTIVRWRRCSPALPRGAWREGADSPRLRRTSQVRKLMELLSCHNKKLTSTARSEKFWYQIKIFSKYFSSGGRKVVVGLLSRVLFLSPVSRNCMELARTCF